MVLLLAEHRTYLHCSSTTVERPRDPTSSILTARSTSLGRDESPRSRETKVLFTKDLRVEVGGPLPIRIDTSSLVPDSPATPPYSPGFWNCLCHPNRRPVAQFLLRIGSGRPQLNCRHGNRRTNKPKSPDDSSSHVRLTFLIETTQKISLFSYYCRIGDETSVGGGGTRNRVQKGSSN